MNILKGRVSAGIPGVAVLFLIVISAAAVSKAAGLETDLDLDGTVERIELDVSKELSLRVFRGEELLWESVPKEWKPWKLLIADVDNDGKREIVVGVFKSTKFFPRPHNCLFIYGWSGEKGFPKWLGSSLGRSLTDFVFVGSIKRTGDKLAALETTLDGKQSLAFYDWNSFGFTRHAEFGPWMEAAIIRVVNGEIELTADGQHVIFNTANIWRNSDEK